MEAARFPFIIGHYYAGIVAAVGDNVTKFRIGDAVYGLTLEAGAAAEYVLIAAKFIHSITHKPTSMSFADAACFVNRHPVVETLLRAESELEGGLRGKTVLVPAGLVSQSVSGSRPLQEQGIQGPVLSPKFFLDTSAEILVIRRVE